MKVKPKRLRYKLRQYRVPVKYVDGWDSPGIDPYNGRSDFHGVVLHHTAGVNSLNYIVNTNPYAPVRACHFLVDRDGTVQVVSGVGAYHAGKGGPWRFPKRGRDVIVPKDRGNQYLYGIEIESLGRTRRIDGSREGMTVEQVVSTSMLCAALLNAMRPGWRSWPVSRVIRHRDWTPRKIDVKQDIEWWHRAIGIARSNHKNPQRAKQLIEQFVKEHPKGRL
jgi:N-acetyl-anhydromuramyl-L-alanine amidase AmpD